MQNCSFFCCSFFGCFLRKISCSDPSVFYDRMQRTLSCLTGWLNQAEVPVCFPSVSTQPSMQPAIDDSLHRLKKGDMYRTSGGGSRNNIFLIASIIIITVSTTPRLFNHPKQNQDRTQWSPGESNPGVLLQTTARMTGNGLCILN